jgi:hypothetical protein
MWLGYTYENGTETPVNLMSIAVLRLIISRMDLFNIPNVIILSRGGHVHGSTFYSCQDVLAMGNKSDLPTTSLDDMFQTLDILGTRCWSKNSDERFDSDVFLEQ